MNFKILSFLLLCVAVAIIADQGNSNIKGSHLRARRSSGHNKDGGVMTQGQADFPNPEAQRNTRDLSLESPLDDDPLPEEGGQQGSNAKINTRDLSFESPLDDDPVPEDGESQESNSKSSEEAEKQQEEEQKKQEEEQKQQEEQQKQQEEEQKQQEEEQQQEQKGEVKAEAEVQRDEPLESKTVQQHEKTVKVEHKRDTQGSSGQQGSSGIQQDQPLGEESKGATRLERGTGGSQGTQGSQSSSLQGSKIQRDEPLGKASAKASGGQGSKATASATRQQRDTGSNQGSKVQNDQPLGGESQGSRSQRDTGSQGSSNIQHDDPLEGKTIEKNEKSTRIEHKRDTASDFAKNLREQRDSQGKSGSSNIQQDQPIGGGEQGSRSQRDTGSQGQQGASRQQRDTGSQGQQHMEKKSILRDDPLEGNTKESGAAGAEIQHDAPMEMAKRDEKQKGSSNNRQKRQIGQLQSKNKSGVMRQAGRTSVFSENKEQHKRDTLITDTDNIQKNKDDERMDSHRMAANVEKREANPQSSSANKLGTLQRRDADPQSSPANKLGTLQRRSADPQSSPANKLGILQRRSADPDSANDNQERVQKQASLSGRPGFGSPDIAPIARGKRQTNDNQFNPDSSKGHRSVFVSKRDSNKMLNRVKRQPATSSQFNPFSPKFMSPGYIGIFKRQAAMFSELSPVTSHVTNPEDKTRETKQAVMEQGVLSPAILGRKKRDDVAASQSHSTSSNSKFRRDTPRRLLTTKKPLDAKISRSERQAAISGQPGIGSPAVASISGRKRRQINTAVAFRSSGSDDEKSRSQKQAALSGQPGILSPSLGRKRRQTDTISAVKNEASNVDTERQEKQAAFSGRKKRQAAISGQPGIGSPAIASLGRRRRQSNSALSFKTTSSDAEKLRHPKQAALSGQPGILSPSLGRKRRQATIDKAIYNVHNTRRDTPIADNKGARNKRQSIDKTHGHEGFGDGLTHNIPLTSFN